MCQDMINIGFLRISGILGFFWGFYPKNPTISKNPENRKIHIWSKTYFFLGVVIFFWVQKNKKKSQNRHFWHLLFFVLKNPRNLKIPSEWQPCGNQTSNIPSVSAFINTNPHMKFQKNKKSGSKVTEGDGPPTHQTDRQTDRQTTRLL